MRCNRLLLLAAVVCLAVPAYTFAGTPDMTSLVPGEVSGGWVASGKPRVFTKETLFEHIDGQADLFLQYGFQRSVFTVYRTKDSSQGKIDLDIYDMGNAIHAFGIFSRFRQDDHPAGIGLDSSLEDRYALFYKGKYFVLLQATESSISSLRQLAQTIASRITDNSLPPKEIGYFPKKGLKRGSIEYYPQGLMGREFLKRGFKATYMVPDKTGTTRDAGGESPESSLFIAIFDNAGEAESALKSFREALSKKGSSSAAPSTQPGFATLRGQDPYQGKLIIMQKGPYLVGAAGFERTKDAEGLLAELIKRIE
jgi:hypothetical protein